MRKTTRFAVLAGATLAGVLLAGCGGDDDDASAGDTATTVASATTAAPTSAAATLEAYVSTMTPICEEFDAAINGATAAVFASEEPDPAQAQEALVGISKAIDTFVAAAGAVPAPADAASIVPAYQDIKQQVDAASATPDQSLEFLSGDDPRGEVAHTADSIGLQACGTGGTFATISEIALSEAPADAVALEAFDFGWKGLPATLPAGEVTFTMTNAAQQDHELLLVPLAPDAVPSDVLTLLTSASGDDLDAAFETIAAGPPGGLYVGPGGGVAGVTELQPGSYAVVCFLPDATTGKGHRELGMASVVQVS